MYLRYLITYSKFYCAFSGQEKITYCLLCCFARNTKDLAIKFICFYILKVFFINIFKLKYNNYQTLNATMLAQTA